MIPAPAEGRYLFGACLCQRCMQELSGKLGLLRAGGVDWVEFRHHALMRLENLDWIGQAMANLAA